MTKNISKTLIIGLGGTGQRVICDIKKRMLRTYGEIPSLVKFLAFDTDEMYGNRSPFRYYHEGHTFEDYKYCIQCNEFYIIPAPSLEAVRRDSICADHLNIEELVMTWRHHRPASNRIAVRACFLNSSRDIINRLSAAISDLRGAAITMHEMADGYNIINNNISVFVIASLAGNTGSSAIMDISRMLQIAGINVHYSANPVCDKIFGMFFLPKFFEAKPHTQNVCINAFTALSELDYTMELADPVRYPAGSPKLVEDQNDYHGFTDNDKRVVYDGVYMVDSFTSRGYTHDFQEASNNVASFIAGSIAADANTLITNYVNSNHKMHSVDGKFQKYSSLGYCELRFNRQELVRYLLNRKLISALEQFKAGDHGVSVSQIAQSFIDVNHLNEGVNRNSEGVDTRPQLNALTDAIFNMDDRQFDSIYFHSVEPGRDAAHIIEDEKIRYLHHIGVAAQQAVQAFGQRKQELIQNLKTLLDNRMKEKGFGRFPDLVKCLKTMFTDMKEGLVDELEWNAKLFDRIDDHELRLIKNTIEENSSRGFLGIGSKLNEQEAAIRWYCDKVRFDNGSVNNPTLAWLRVDTARKREAAAIYEKMIEILDSYYKEKTVETLNGIETWITGSFLNVDALHRGLHDQLLKENNCYRPTKAAKNEILFADAYFKEYFEQHEANEMNLTMQAEHELEQCIGQLFAAQPVADASLLVQMRGKLLDLLGNDDIVKRIHGYTVTTKDANDNYFETKVMMSIDELFILCFGTYNQIADPNDIETYPQLRMLKTLENNFDLLWHYKPFTEGLAPEKHMIIGVYDTQNSIFSPQNGYQDALNRRNNDYYYINFGDPDRIAFMLTETAIPAHKLEGVEYWAKEFMYTRQNYYPFSDKRLEDIDMIMPDMYEEAEIAWAYGWLFGLIANPTNRRGLRVKPSHDYVVRNTINIEEGDFYNYFKNMRPSDIYECHQEFIKDQELSNDILQQAMVLLDNDPVGNAIKIRQWVNDGQMWDHDVRGKQRTTMTPEEIEVIQNEVKYLAMCFDKLGISLNECGRVV